MLSSKLMIFGNGPIALSLALGCQKLGFEVELVRQPIPAHAAEDPRAWAMRSASLNFLKDLGLPLATQSPISAMAVGHGDRVGSALPGELFLKNQNAKPLGAILPNAALREEFEAILVKSGLPVRQLSQTDVLPDPMELQAEVKASLALICDPVWNAAFPNAEQPARSGWAYDQIAVTAPVTLSSAHEGVARQIFLPSGPLALLPLPDPHQASLVWSLSKNRWAGLQHLPDLASFVSEATGVQVSFDANKLVSFPLRAEHASAYVGRGFAILGDAAHRIHPLAGQGLNLGLADAGALLDTLSEARSVGSDLGSPFALTNFERRRRPQNEAMRAATDQLKALFGSGFGPVRFARALGLRAFDASPLKTKLLEWMSDETPISSSLSRKAAVPRQAA